MAEDKLLIVVCTANMCRSPMAEGILRARLGEQSGWRVLSAGVMAVPGSPATQEARQAAAEIGINLDGHRSRPLTEDLVQQADLLVTMTKMHAAMVMARFPEADGKTRLLSTFGCDDSFRDIPDPVGQPLTVYRHCRDDIESAVADLVLTLRGKGEPEEP